MRKTIASTSNLGYSAGNKRGRMAKNNIPTMQETKKEMALGALPIAFLLIGLLLGLGLGYFIGSTQVKDVRVDGTKIDPYTGRTIN